MNEADRKLMRAEIALPILTVQKRLRERGVPMEEVIPEIIAALLSLVAMIAKDNAEISREMFLRACFAVSAETWK